MPIDDPKTVRLVHLPHGDPSRVANLNCFNDDNYVFVKRRHIAVGLECRLEIERGRFSKALKLIEDIKNRAPIVYKTMERDALAGELATSALSDELRIRYSTRLELLNSELETKDVAGSWLTLVR